MCLIRRLSFKSATRLLSCASIRVKVLLINFFAVILGLGGSGRGSGPYSESTISLATLCIARSRALSSKVSSDARSFVIFAIASLLEFIFNLIGAVMALNYYEVLEIPRSATEA